VKALNEVLKSHENAGKLAEVEIHFTVPEGIVEGYVDKFEVKTACYDHKQEHPGHSQKYLGCPSL
jgi:hypothetical protein